MLTYSFENLGGTSLYEHLYDSIKNDILSGKLLPDYKLPSKRTFAKNLGISTITVENSYAQLIAEGYIYSIPKKGYYVSDISTIQSSHMLYKQSASSKDTYKSIKQNIASDAGSLTTQLQDNTAASDVFADLTSNRTDTSTFPFYTWTKILKDVSSDNSDELMTPSPAAGVFKLRQAIADHLSGFRGMNISYEQVIIGAGTEYLYSLIIQLLGHDKTFAVEDPGYSKIRRIYESNNVNCMCIPLDNDGINIRALEESHADIIHLSPSHHYPTGIITPISRRYELLGWAAKDDSRYIIEDDYDCEFRFYGKPIPSLQSIDIQDKVIYMNTFTKSLSPTIRISYMVLPPSLVQIFNARLGFYSCTVSNFEQYTLAKFIDDGHFEKHINRMRGLYKKQREYFINLIENSRLSNIATIQALDTGLHFLMKIDTHIPDATLIKKARENGLKIAFLSQYYYDKRLAVEHTLVINYSSVTEEQMQNAVNILCKIL